MVTDYDGEGVSKEQLFERGGGGGGDPLTMIDCLVRGGITEIKPFFSFSQAASYGEKKSGRKALFLP